MRFVTSSPRSLLRRSPGKVDFFGWSWIASRNHARNTSIASGMLVRYVTYFKAACFVIYLLSHLSFLLHIMNLD